MWKMIIQAWSKTDKIPPVSENRFLETIAVRSLWCRIPSEEWLRVPIEIPLKYTWKEPVLSNCNSSLILRKFDFNLNVF